MVKGANSTYLWGNYFKRKIIDMHSANNDQERIIPKNNINCWEYMRCGREPGGNNAEELGICPAASQDKYNTVNNGKNGGRFCWFINKTECKDIVHEDFIDRFEHCQECEFFLLVQKQENRHLEVVRNDLL